MSEKIDFVQKIVTWIEEKQIFSRERKSNEQSSLIQSLRFTIKLNGDLQRWIPNNQSRSL